MSFDFNNKVVLVAGASSGMGRALALRLANEGAHLIVTARRKERLESLASEIGRRGGQCLPLAADAEDPDAAAQVVAAGMAHFGRIDLAVLNTGGAPALDMRQMSAREVTAYMRSNYDTVVNYLFPILAQMVKQKGGVIAHTNSLAGFLGVPLQGPFSAAKGACCLTPVASNLRRLAFVSCRSTPALWPPKPPPAMACPHRWKSRKRKPLSTSCLHFASNARTTCFPGLCVGWCVWLACCPRH